MKPIIRQYQSGLTSVLFNTRDKWMDYSVYCSMGTDSVLYVGLDTFEHELADGTYPSLVERFEISLPNSCLHCVRYIDQEKDQIEVLFVPRNMLTT